MSPLAFDKDGQPFTFSPKTVALLVRRFRNPGGRGTCEQVFDDEGDALILDASATVAELRAAVGHVAGLYRLDQCDEEGEVIAGAPAAYIAIDPPRNGSPGSSTDPLLIVRDLAQMHAEVSKTLADRSAGMMQAATENMRVATGSGVGNRRLLGALANAAAAVDAPTDEHDGDDDEEEGDDELPAALEPDPWAMLRPFTPMITAMAPKIGEAIAAKLVDLVNQFMKAGPAAAPGATTATASATASAPSPSDASAHGAAAGQGATSTAASSPPPPSASSPEPAAETGSGAPNVTPDASADTPQPSTATATAVMGSVMEVRNAAPTGAQIAHLLAIRAQLAPREVAIVDRAIAGMDEPTRAWWLDKLSALSVEQATAHVRTLIPSVPSRGGREE